MHPLILLLTDMTVPLLERRGVDQDRSGADAIILRRPAGRADQEEPGSAVAAARISGC